MKVLIDEMDDGMDDKLTSLGYEAYSVRKLNVNEHKGLKTDYKVIIHAWENDMVIITKDSECGQACIENGIKCVLIDSEEILKLAVKKLEEMK